MTHALSEDSKQSPLVTGAARSDWLAGDIAPPWVPRTPRAGYITGETLHVNGGMYMI
jgi:hypothetical protein